MRMRFWLLLVTAVLTIMVGGCAGSRSNRGPANTPVPTKTLRPTFTATAPEPTWTPTVVPPTETPIPPEPSPTPVPPTPEPSPTSEAAVLTVTSASLNVRSGPSTAYGVIGRVTNGQSFPVTGKNAGASWWQIDYNGRAGWVIGTNVSVRNDAVVQVAQNIPAAPTAAPRPTARPAAVQPTAAPAPSTARYAATNSVPYPDTNDWITIYCLKFDKSGSLSAGTIRVTRDGQAVGPDVAFSEFATWYLTSGYNAGCKVEIKPAVNGNYTAVLLEGGQAISDVINFTVTGQGDRIRFVEWKQR